MTPPVREPWMDAAACARPEVDPDWWFATEAKDGHLLAMGYCNACDVQPTCLGYVLDHLDLTDGIWAGFTIRQIGKMRRKKWNR